MKGQKQMGNFTMKIEWTGPEEHKRFLITRGDDRHYWTGDAWTPNAKDALLFATHQEACREFQKLADEQFTGQPVRRFTLLATVTVRGDQQYTVDELKEYLSAVCSLSMNTTVRGYGPMPDSYAVVELPWDELQEEV
jgi:hypothetical protein